MISLSIDGINPNSEFDTLNPPSQPAVDLGTDIDSQNSKAKNQ